VVGDELALGAPRDRLVGAAVGEPEEFVVLIGAVRPPEVLDRLTHHEVDLVVRRFRLSLAEEAERVTFRVRELTVAQCVNEHPRLIVGEIATRDGVGNGLALRVGQRVAGERVGNRGDLPVGEVARTEYCTDSVSLGVVEVAVRERVGDRLTLSG